MKDSVDDFIRQYKYIAIGTAIAVCVIQVITSSTLLARYIDLLLTHADDSCGSTAFSGVCVCVCVCVRFSLSAR